MVQLLLSLIPLVVIIGLLFVFKIKITNWKRFLVDNYVLSFFIIVFVLVFGYVLQLIFPLAYKMGTGLFYYLVFAATLEEVPKFLAILLSKPKSNKDILLNGIFIATFFSILEHYMYFSKVLANTHIFVRLFTPGHVFYLLFTIWGMILGRKKNKKALFTGAGFLAAIIVHTIWDTVASNNVGNLVAIIVGVIEYAAIIYSLYLISKEEKGVQPQVQNAYATNVNNMQMNNNYNQGYNQMNNYNQGYNNMQMNNYNQGYNNMQMNNYNQGYNQMNNYNQGYNNMQVNNVESSVDEKDNGKFFKVKIIGSVLVTIFIIFVYNMGNTLYKMNSVCHLSQVGYDITVTSAEEIEKENVWTGEKAKVIRVGVTIKNTSDSEKSLDVSNLYLKRISDDETTIVSFRYTDDDSLQGGTIAPGEERSGYMYYESTDGIKNNRLVYRDLLNKDYKCVFELK